MSNERMKEYERKHKQAQDAAHAVPHKILVMSGKGGVGKTTVAVNLAFALAEKGLKVGVLDTDIHGPNVAFMAGVEGKEVEGDVGQLEPVQATDSVRVLSISTFLPSRDTPVIWRGPRKAGAIQQLLGEANWKGVDVLVVDCPPGTGDEPLSVAQLIPDADGVVVVTTPQEVALLDSRKCINFAGQLGMDVLGVVENMSGYVCPHCGESSDLFKTGGGEKAAGEMGVPFLGRIPLTAAVVQSGDGGKPVVVADSEDPAAGALLGIADKMKEIFSKVEKAREAAQKREAEAGDESAKRRIAVAADGDENLEAPVGAHFGRAPFYAVVEVQGDEVKGSKFVKNPHAESHTPGKVPEFVHSLDAHVILSGGMGQRAIQKFQGYGIQVGIGAKGTVQQALDAFLAGKLTDEGGCQHSHGGCGGHH